MDKLDKLSLVLSAQRDPNVFLDNPYFSGDMAGRIYPKQRKLFCDFYNGGYKELDLAKGMGGGGSYLGSVFLARDCFDVLQREDPAGDFNLSNHSLVTLFAIAKSAEQSCDTIFGEVKRRMRAPYFQEFEPKMKVEEITFDGHPDIQICAGGAVSAGSLMGRNVKSIVFDEITSYDETQSQRGAWQVYTRLRKSTNRFGIEGHVYVISMVWHVHDIVLTLVRDKKPGSLTDIVATWEMNPNKPFESPEMQQELARDPLTFWRDYGCKPFGSYESFYPDDNIVNVNLDRINILDGAWELWKTTPEFTVTKEHTYILSTDPGRRNDTFGIGILHKEGKKTIFDGLMRLSPKKNSFELDPIEVRDFCVWICGVFPIRAFVTDVAALYFADLEKKVRRLGIKVISHPNVREDHEKVKRAWFDNTLELCNFPEIKGEFKELTVLNSKKIGVPKGAIIDMVDTVTRGYWASNSIFADQGYAHNIIKVIK